MIFMSDENEFPEKFSDDEEEHLRIENEILKIKLQAELGAEMHSLEGTENLSPEIENLFLKNILSFEKQFESGEAATVFDLLNKPSVKSVTELNEDEIEEALENLEILMLEKNIEVDYALDYSAREKYRFLTEDLFKHKTMPVNLPGIVIHFSYEDFYPNHELLIEENTKAFIDHWFQMDFSDESWELASEFLMDNNTYLPQAEALKKFENIFASYQKFEDCVFEITNIFVHLEDEDKTGIGFSEGTVSYKAVLENSETITIEGTFKLTMQLSEKEWVIYAFEWPSFKW